ncbi:MAG: (d)CMP kinase [Spiroplasma sp.]|nr:(d)CMP kinase [Mycoplasmatales bacterium]
MIIAIDGPAGSGKSTIAKIIAKELNLKYLDTGAMFRMVTYYLLINNIDVNNPNDVAHNLENISINMENNNFFLNDVDVSMEIRSIDVTKNVALIASYKSVRDLLLKQQREIALKADSILDGRDIGSVVFPNAEFKFYLDASVEARAQRRFLQNKNQNSEQSLKVIKKEIEQRDYSDMNRIESPLVRAKDAQVIDSSELEIDDVVKIITKKIK